MTSDENKNTNSPHQHKASGKARLVDLGQMYELGNKAALYEAIQVSSDYGLALPKWAVAPLQELVVDRWKPRRSKWKGTRKPIDGGYAALVARYLRAEVYRSAKAFTKNKNYYRIMPTKCIQAWYDGDFKNVPDTAEGALHIALVGLKGTIGECDITTLKKHQYFGADAEVDKLVEDDPEGAAYLEMNTSEVSKMDRTALRDARRLPMSFGFNPTEVIFGLRKDEQFWGPPSDPPEKVLKILAKETPIGSDAGNDFMEEN